MSYRDMELGVEGRVARITLRRPEKRNALRALTVAELCHALERARDDDSVRVVVLEGAGGTFCAGGDIAEMERAGGEVEGTIPPRTFLDLNLAFTRLGKPAIASVAGAALGGGTALVTGCHLAIAAEDAVFGTPEVNLGLWPMLVMAGLVRAVGRRAALRLMLEGERISAREAARVGLVHEVVASAELAPRTQALAARLAERSPVVTRLGLEAFHAIDGQGFEAALDYLDRQLAVVLGTEDAREGLRAFLEKRKPVFAGR